MDRSTEIVDDHGGATGGEQRGIRLAQPSPSAGDNGDPVLKVNH
jgi:hypothetical protein